ncbi:MAG TPA: hypothetical protein VFV34_07260 [Blastocatellia bacterium]|nr:hypothetical protein [Blastocatellia bacterium]
MKTALVEKADGCQSGGHQRDVIYEFIYVRDPDSDGFFVITAYEVGRRAISAYGRRRKKKQEMKQNKYPTGWNAARFVGY